MNGREPINWKLAAVPLTVFTAALAFGINYFVGTPGDTAAPATSAAGFKFDSSPDRTPGALTASAGAQGGSSIEMFRKVNENYSKETSASGSRDMSAAAKKPMTRKELEAFMRQLHHEINFDPAAQAAAEAKAAQQEGRGIYNPLLKNGRQEPPAAAGTAVHSGHAAQSMPRLQTADAGLARGRKSAFSAGATGAGMSRGGPGARRAAGLEQEGDSASGSGGYSAGPGESASAGGGGGMYAGDYGSHGGGQAAGSSAEAQSGASGGGSQAPQEKHIPAPVSFIWPRSFDFGNMFTYETASRLVIVMNIGDARLAVGKIENMDPGTPFILEKDKCSGALLAPKQSCTFRVRFSPGAVNDYVSGFSVPSNDNGSMAYQGYIEVKGSAKYSYLTWWWHQSLAGTAGYTNRLDFDMVPEGYSMDEVLRIYNNTSENWHKIKLDNSALPASFKLSGDGCSGQDLGPRQSCSVTVDFVPDSATNKRFSSAYYGQYSAVNMNTGATLYSPRPKFPPLVFDKPVEADPKGELRVLTGVDKYHSKFQQVLAVPISAKSCAPFPVYGLERVQHYYYFR